MSDFQRRHYIALANALRDAKPHYESTAPTVNKVRLKVWGECVTSVASTLAEDNSYFNINKFYDACGME